MVSPLILMQAFGSGGDPPEEGLQNLPRSLSHEDLASASHSPADGGAPLERRTSHHSLISRLSHPLSRAHSRRSHDFDPEDQHHHIEHLNHDEDAIREEAEAEADLDAAEAEDLALQGRATNPSERVVFQTSNSIAFQDQRPTLTFAGGRGGAGRVRSNTIDSTLTGSTMSTWASNQQVGRLRGWLRRLRHFVFQSGPDHLAIDFVPNYRYVNCFHSGLYLGLTFVSSL